MASVDDVRRISLALPGAEEVLTWGEHPTFRVRGRIFAIAGHEPDRVSIKATPEVQSDLIDLDPETYSIASHVGRYGWVAVALERIEPELVRPLLVEAWRMTAPRKLLREVSEARPVA
ncbi:MAG TPA: MmcQ/YjbR family DNA-binding protein [Candidatus Limnocylindrales bacterium]